MLTLSQVNDTIEKVLSKSKAQEYNSVYEMSDDQTYYKLVICFDNLSFQDVLIVHTKFVFKTNLEKTGLLDDSFFYLYDINCEYRKASVISDDDESLYKELYGIILYKKFGADILALSNFQLAVTAMNNHFYNKKNADFSVFNIAYKPNPTIRSCEDTTFKFEINMSNDVVVEMELKKLEKQYEVSLSYLEKTQTYLYDSITNLPEMIAQELLTFL